MQYGIAFAPLVPAYVVWAALAVTLIIAALLLAGRSRGAVIRSIALALMVLALANPSFTREDREPLTSVAAVVVDKSPSQNFGERQQQTEAARTTLLERLARIPGLEVRTVEAGQSDGETDGTRLFSALGTALADVPPDRVAGAILITDGRVHDVPAEASALGFAAPLHALITGNKDERDRRVALITAPTAYTRPEDVQEYLVDDGFTPDKATALRLHREYNEIVRQVARSEKTLVVDCDSTFEANPQKKMLFGADGIHPNEYGHWLIGMELLRGFVRQGWVDGADYDLEQGAPPLTGQSRP